jgi:hypothetical protein
VTLVTAERPPKTVLTSTDTALLLRVSNRTLFRIPRDQLPYSETPGGGQRRHRRYRRGDVVHYALEFLGLDIDEDEDRENPHQ